MEFSDNVVRDPLEVVYVRRSEQDMESREEFFSNLWRLEKKLKKENLYSTPARDVRIWESIYDKDANEIAYRVS